MLAAVVTGITNARHAHFQELRVVRPVRFVAIGAIFQNWRVVPQERPAPLGVAAEAVLVRAGFNDLLHQVAVDASHPARLMRAASPEQVIRASRVAIETYPVLLRDRVWRIL